MNVVTRISAVVLAGMTLIGAAGQSIRFVDVSATSGIVYAPAHPGGVAVGDYNADGWLDVCLSGGVNGTQIFRNNGDKTFTNVSADVLPADAPDAHIPVFADLNDDGYPELLLGVRHASFDSSFRLLINDAGVFDYSTLDPNTSRHESRVGGLAVGDMDADGDLDIVMVHGNVLSPATGPGIYLSNEGGNQFVDRTDWFRGGLRASRPYHCAAIADFNNDGAPDLHVAVDFLAGTLHDRRRADGNGYVNVAGSAGVIRGSSDMGLAIGDLQNDGDLDIYSVNIGIHHLYINDGSGVFEDEGQERGVRFNGRFGVGWGSAFCDFDHDRDLDLVYATSGGPFGSLFENDGSAHFQDVTDSGGLVLRGFGLVAFDYDQDGDQDLLIEDDTLAPRLYENISPGLGERHWLNVSLRGVESNRPAIGARVEVTAGGVTMMREIMSSQSFHSGVSKRAHFGLGAAPRAERVRIVWPSGAVQTMHNVAADQFLSIDEDVCQGDINGDARVGLTDLAFMLSALGACNGESAYDAAADIDHDGCVRLEDLLVLLDAFGTICR